MIDPTDLVSGVLRGVLGGRPKRSRKALRYLTGRGGGMWSNPNVLLTAAGVAWGIFETLQGEGQPQGATAGPGLGGGAAPAAPSAAAPASTAPLPPLPNVPGAPQVPADAVRIIRLTIAAANADGTLTEADQAKIVEHARAAGAEHVLEHELRTRRPLPEIVAGVTDPAQRATLYVLAFSIVRSDESVSGAERIFLAQLANQLGLDPPTVSKLESDAAARIDAQEP
jgi:uncharacterized membrane protein YebE (DUF533 family)